MVEVEHARFALAAVGARRAGEDGEHVAHVALVTRGAPGHAAEVAAQSPPTGATRGSPAMAVDTDDVAAVGLGGESLKAHAAPHERRDLRSLGADMVELEDDRVGQAAVRAAA